jgi:hypothetical protein
LIVFAATVQPPTIGAEYLPAVMHPSGALLACSRYSTSIFLALLGTPRPRLSGSHSFFGFRSLQWLFFSSQHRLSLR